VRRNNALFIVGLVLLIAGAATLVYGFIMYNDASKAFLPSLSKALTGSSQEGNQATTLMLVGGGAALLGLLILISPRFRRR
jgi:hypothetical protein